ncbi:MAG: hypothetical protein KDD66_07520 [Bdellovibrionales bacterium]|nr:hypothetical protein [Bdellovibrionales bacterium]
MNHSVSQPFELERIGAGSKVFAFIEFILGAAFAYVAYEHFHGRYIVPELASAPLDLLCGGLAFVCIAMALTSFSGYRAWRIDPGSQKLFHVSKGMFGTKHANETAFNQISHVGVELQNQGTSSNRRNYYPVYVYSKDESKTRVFNDDRYLRSRSIAEKIAKAANVDFHDDSQPGPTQIRQPAELDETVQNKLRKNFHGRHAPTTPTKLHAKIRPDMSSLVIDIPPFDVRSLGPMKKGLGIMLTIFGGTAVVLAYFENYAFALFFGFIVLVFVYLLLRSETIKVTGDSLEVSDGISFLKRKRKIPLTELEELCLLNVAESESKEADQLLESGEVTKEVHSAIESFVALGSAIVARSDRASITFGRVLSNAELDHILYQLESRIRN